MVHGDKFNYYQSGYDPAWAGKSVGLVLLARTVQDAFAEGLQEFDFLRGDEAYKYRWLPEVRTNARLLLARPRSLRSGAMLRLNRLENYVEHQAKAFAQKRKMR